MDTGLPSPGQLPGNTLTRTDASLGGGGLSRVRVRRTLDGREPDRVPVVNMEPSEAPTSSASDLRVAAGSDLLLVSADLTPRYPIRILEQDGDAVVQTSPYGGVGRISPAAGGRFEVLDYPVKTHRDWEHISGRLEMEPDRIDWAAIGSAAAPGAERLYVALEAPIGLRSFSAYLGRAAALDTLGADPGFVREISDAHAGLLIEIIGTITEADHAVDGLLLFDEPANRRGLLFDRTGFRQALAPSLRRLADFCHGRGIKVIYYAEGDLRLLTPDLVEAGVDCLGPLDSAAGMDLPALKLNYGADLSFMGGIDRRALLSSDPTVLEREIACKVRAGMIGGRYIGGFDGPLTADLPAGQIVSAASLIDQYGKY